MMSLREVGFPAQAAIRCRMMMLAGLENF